MAKRQSAPKKEKVPAAVFPCDQGVADLRSWRWYGPLWNRPLTREDWKDLPRSYFFIGRAHNVITEPFDGSIALASAKAKTKKELTESLMPCALRYWLKTRVKEVWTFKLWLVSSGIETMSLFRPCDPFCVFDFDFTHKQEGRPSNWICVPRDFVSSILLGE